MAKPRHYLREWRKFRHLTQSQVVARLESLDDDLIPRTEASLSRIETGAQIYTERLLHALADIYSAEPAHLIGRNPYAEGEVVDLMARMDEATRRQAMVIVHALAESATPFTPAPDPDAPLCRQPRRRQSGASGHSAFAQIASAASSSLVSGMIGR